MGVMAYRRPAEPEAAAAPLFSAQVTQDRMSAWHASRNTTTG
jgi:hypothetical protein